MLSVDSLEAARLRSNRARRVVRVVRVRSVGVSFR
jgi:hypothetical protein